MMSIRIIDLFDIDEMKRTVDQMWLQCDAVITNYPDYDMYYCIYLYRI